MIAGGFATSAPALAADKDPGARAFQVCISCHAIDPDVTDQPGPNLSGILGRPIASLPGYKYTAAMKAFAKKNGKWSLALIERFIQDPVKVVPGTRMEQPPGVEDEGLRKLVLEYLAKQG